MRKIEAYRDIHMASLLHHLNNWINPETCQEFKDRKNPLYVGGGFNIHWTRSSCRREHAMYALDAIKSMQS